MKYPGASPEAIDFLEKVLVFNPYFRISLADCLDHPLFEQVRQKDKEEITGKQVVLEFEKEELDRNKLREYILKEAEYFLK